MIDIMKARELLKRATPGPWMVATSNSWRRIVTSFLYDGVIEPVTQRSDGHPDLHDHSGGANLELICFLRNNAEELLAAAEAQERVNELHQRQWAAEGWRQHWLQLWGFIGQQVLIRDLMRHLVAHLESDHGY